MVLAKITIKHEYSSSVKGVAAYHGSVCVEPYAATPLTPLAGGTFSVLSALV